MWTWQCILCALSTRLVYNTNTRASSEASTGTYIELHKCRFQWKISIGELHRNLTLQNGRNPLEPPLEPSTGNYIYGRTPLEILSNPLEPILENFTGIQWNCDLPLEHSTKTFHCLQSNLPQENSQQTLVLSQCSVSARTCTPSSSSSSGGDGGGVLTSTSSVTDSSLFLLESFLAALAPPSDSTFLLLRDRKRGRRSQHTAAVRTDDIIERKKNCKEFKWCMCMCVSICPRAASPCLIYPFRNH